MIFVSDLDNTLIYSYKRNLPPDKVIAEWYDGRVISYMTQTSYQTLQTIQQAIPVIPLTTRSTAQYMRILFPTPPTLALVANGGILLKDGVPDPAWYAYSKQLTASVFPILQQAISCLETDPNRILEVRFVDDLFLFTKSEQPIQTIDRLKAQLDTTQVDLLHHGLKVYVLPKQLDKGTALCRLRERFPHTAIYGAGDSPFDIPFLQAVDFAFFPATLSYTPHSQQSYQCIPPAQGIFSDILLSSLQSQITKDDFSQ